MGIEPICDQITLSTPYKSEGIHANVVPEKRFELSRISAAGFESAVSTIPPFRYYICIKNSLSSTFSFALHSPFVIKGVFVSSHYTFLKNYSVIERGFEPPIGFRHSLENCFNIHSGTQSFYLQQWSRQDSNLQLTFVTV